MERTSRSHLCLIAIAVAALLAGGCNALGVRTDSSDYAPLKRARATAVENLNLTLKPGERYTRPGDSPAERKDDERKEAPEPLVVRAGSQTQASPPWYKRFDVFSVISFPLTLLWEGARHVVVEDADPVGRACFETRVVYGHGDAIHPFKADDEFEVVVDYIEIDAFSAGRLRDSWGGDGGEVSVQVSLNALSDGGLLVRDDTSLLVRQGVKRRSPLLAILKGTTKGRDAVERLEKGMTRVQKAVSEAQAKIAEIKAIVNEVDALAKKPETLDKDLVAKLDTYRAKFSSELTKLLEDQPDELRQLAQSVVDSVFDEIRDQLPDLTKGVAGWAGRVSAAAEKHLESVTALLDYFDRYGVDEQGIYEQAKIIVGLADADRRTTMEFENVRPSLLHLGSEPGGTAATVLDEAVTRSAASASGQPNQPKVAGGEADAAGDVDTEQRELALDSDQRTGRNPMLVRRGLVYRGRIRDLARVDEGIGGFSLSFLMIDRGDDRVVRALRALQQYADERGLTVGGGVSQVEVSAIVDGIAALAQKIAEDKVELRAIDLRFMTDVPRSGATPGTEVFTLAPCAILVSRNLHGRRFGAVAQLSIRPVAPARTH